MVESFYGFIIVNLDTFSPMIILVSANIIYYLSANIFHLLADRYTLYCLSYMGGIIRAKNKNDIINSTIPA